MATDAVPVVDTPCNSTNTVEAVHSQGPGSCYGLKGFVLGTVFPPSPFITRLEGQQLDNPSFLIHKKQDKFLTSWLLSTITDDVLVHLTLVKTSFDIWTTIERRFSAKSNLKISSILHALYSLKKLNLTVKEYVSKLPITKTLKVARNNLLAQIDILKNISKAAEGKVVAGIVAELMGMVEASQALDHNIRYVKRLDI
ncbi:hypothetical protein PVK06_005939 [Gossypium arboreum]|uniref:Uncharacterized protein n=1 Tax=Gossypium arboreum TaxID=29729 RepID=A0ABR0QX86_GOSAR|nr:hypothetical protein PVK06_005939 [Gossypium arboreum]